MKAPSAILVLVPLQLFLNFNFEDNRRIGGLQFYAPSDKNPLPDYRRIGGLTIFVILLMKLTSDYRRIGGLLRIERNNNYEYFT